MGDSDREGFRKRRRFATARRAVLARRIPRASQSATGAGEAANGRRWALPSGLRPRPRPHASHRHVRVGNGAGPLAGGCKAGGLSRSKPAVANQAPAGQCRRRGMVRLLRVSGIRCRKMSSAGKFVSLYAKCRGDTAESVTVVTLTR